MRVVAYSDFHCGITANYDKFALLCDFVDSYKPDLVIGCGDNIELTWRTWEQVITWKPSVSALARMWQVASQIDWLELCGNHNLNMQDYYTELLPIRLTSSQHITVDGVVYTHGNQFDPVYNYWWRHLAEAIKLLAPKLYSRLFGTPYELKQLGKDKSYSKLVGLIEANAQSWAGNRSIVFGHTHSEFIKSRKDCWVANTGDIVDSCSYLVVSDGKPELRWL